MTDVDTVTALPLTPFPEPGRDREALADNRLLVARHAADRDAAWQLIEEGLRAGLWRFARLWLHLAELEHSPGDYARLRALWLDSPRGCRAMHSAVSVVARAAALDGEHDEGRVLARKALLLMAQHNRRFSNRFKRAARIGTAEQHIPMPELGTDTESAATATYFRVYEALATGDKAGLTAGVAELRALGEGDWLARL